MLLLPSPPPKLGKMPLRDFALAFGLCTNAAKLSYPNFPSPLKSLLINVSTANVVYSVRPARMRSSFPLLEPGPPRFFGGMKTANKPHASRNYTQDH